MLTSIPNDIWIAILNTTLDLPVLPYWSPSHSSTIQEYLRSIIGEGNSRGNQFIAYADQLQQLKLVCKFWRSLILEFHRPWILVDFNPAGVWSCLRGGTEPWRGDKALGSDKILSTTLPRNIKRLDVSIEEFGMPQSHSLKCYKWMDEQIVACGNQLEVLQLNLGYGSSIIHQEIVDDGSKHPFALPRVFHPAQIFPQLRVLSIEGPALYYSPFIPLITVRLRNLTALSLPLNCSDRPVDPGRNHPSITLPFLTTLDITLTKSDETFPFLTLWILPSLRHLRLINVLASHLTLFFESLGRHSPLHSFLFIASEQSSYQLPSNIWELFPNLFSIGFDLAQISDLSQIPRLPPHHPLYQYVLLDWVTMRLHPDPHMALKLDRLWKALGRKLAQMEVYVSQYNVNGHNPARCAEHYLHLPVTFPGLRITTDLDPALIPGPQPGNCVVV